MWLAAPRDMPRTGRVWHPGVAAIHVPLPWRTPYCARPACTLRGSGAACAGAALAGLGLAAPTPWAALGLR